VSGGRPKARARQGITSDAQQLGRTVTPYVRVGRTVTPYVRVRRAVTPYARVGRAVTPYVRVRIQTN